MLLGTAAHESEGEEDPRTHGECEHYWESCMEGCGFCMRDMRELASDIYGGPGTARFTANDIAYKIGMNMVAGPEEACGRFELDEGWL